MKTKTIEELREDSNRMRTVGTAGAAASIAGAVLVGLVSAPLAAVVGLAGAGVAAIGLVRKLGDDRAAAQLAGTIQAAPSTTTQPEPVPR